MNNTEYPVKMMLDEHRQPFFPFTTIDSVLVNNSDKTAADLFAERYTKEEVDQIISDLGTLQRLCGRVDTVEDLYEIENPQPGDTYLVGTVPENNSEWMYIGDEWEELGPMVDLSVYYLKTEVDALLLALNNTLTNAINAGDAETLGTARGLITEINNRLGANTDLNTTDKTTFVAAINEVVSNLSSGLSNLETTLKAYADGLDTATNTKIGNLNSLTTLNHTDLVSAINELNTNISNLNTALTTGLPATLQSAKDYTDACIAAAHFPVLKQITLTTSWNLDSNTNTYYQDVAVTGLTEDSNIIVQPDPASFHLWTIGQIYASSIHSTNKIRFVALSRPAEQQTNSNTYSEIYVNVVIL